MNKIEISPKLRDLAKILFIIYFAILVKLVFFKYPLHEILNSIKNNHNIAITINLTPFETIFLYLKELPYSYIAIKNIFGNLVLFVPFGFLLPMIFHQKFSYKSITLISLLLILFVEIMQYILKIGSFDIDDIILNLSGAICGYWLMRSVFFCNCLK